MNYQLPVNLSCLLNPLSYGVVGTNILRELDKLGLKVCLFPLDINPQTYQENTDLINRCLRNADEYNRRATSVVINQQFALHTHVGKSLQIGFPIFELNRFTPRELTHLRNQDKIVVCSQFGKDILLENKILNEQDIHIIGLGIDQSIFFPNPINPKLLEEKQTPTRFIHVGKIELRKGLYELLDYFESAFLPTDNVELYLLWGSFILEQRSPEEIKKWRRLYEASPMISKIKMIDWLPSQADIANLLRKSHCFISLSKAEGFNLPALEALGTALPIIITDYSAHKEYSTKDTAMLLPVGDLEIALDNVFFNGFGGQWASLTDDTKSACVQHMREVYRKHQNGESLFNHKGLEMSKNFTWENSARKLAEIL